MILLDVIALIRPVWNEFYCSRIKIPASRISFEYSTSSVTTINNTNVVYRVTQHFGG